MDWAGIMRLNEAELGEIFTERVAGFAAEGGGGFRSRNPSEYRNTHVRTYAYRPSTGERAVSAVIDIAYVTGVARRSRDDPTNHPVGNRSGDPGGGKRGNGSGAKEADKAASSTR